ncbi:hypothetical protein ACOMHN_046398 [Nucella lapillus]
MHVEHITGFGCSQMSTEFIADVQLKRAVEQAQREGSERPLVMQQLRTKIQLARLRGGKDELAVSFEEPKTYELTEEEKRRQDKRKKRNRVAAKKSRVKKKEQLSQLKKKNQMLRKRNDRLRAEVNTLYDLTSGLQEGTQRVRNCPHSQTAQPVLVLPGPPSRPVPSSQLDSGRTDTGQFSRDLSHHQFSRGQRIIIRGDTNIVGKRITKASFAPRVVFPRHRTVLDAETLKRRGQPLSTSASSPEDVMEVEDSTPKTLSSPRMSRDTTPRPVPTITIGGASDRMMPAGSRHSGPPIIIPVEQEAGNFFLSGTSFLDLLKEVDYPEQVREGSPNGALTVPGHVGNQQDVSLFVDPPQGQSSAKVLTSPGSPSFPNTFCRTMQLSRES